MDLSTSGAPLTLANSVFFPPTWLTAAMRLSAEEKWKRVRMCTVWLAGALARSVGTT